jgi:hypothetical protein
MAQPLDSVTGMKRVRGDGSNISTPFAAGSTISTPFTAGSNISTPFAAKNAEPKPIFLDDEEQLAEYAVRISSTELDRERIESACRGRKSTKSYKQWDEQKRREFEAKVKQRAKVKAKANRLNKLDCDRKPLSTGNKVMHVISTKSASGSIPDGTEGVVMSVSYPTTQVRVKFSNGVHTTISASSLRFIRQDWRYR